MLALDEIWELNNSLELNLSCATDIHAIISHMKNRFFFIVHRSCSNPIQTQVSQISLCQWDYFICFDGSFQLAFTLQLCHTNLSYILTFWSISKCIDAKSAELTIFQYDYVASNKQSKIILFYECPNVLNFLKYKINFIFCGNLQWTLQCGAKFCILIANIAWNPWYKKVIADLKKGKLYIVLFLSVTVLFLEENKSSKFMNLL